MQSQSDAVRSTISPHTDATRQQRFYIDMDATEQAELLAAARESGLPIPEGFSQAGTAQVVKAAFAVAVAVLDSPEDGRGTQVVMLDQETDSVLSAIARGRASPWFKPAVEFVHGMACYGARQCVAAVELTGAEIRHEATDTVVADATSLAGAEQRVSVYVRSVLSA